MPHTNTAAAPRLHDLPDAALHRILLHLLGAASPGSTPAYAPLALHGRSLERLQNAADLSRACAAARRLLRAAVGGLSIRWDDPVAAGVVGFFAPGLRSLAVSRHCQAPVFVAALARSAPPLAHLRLAACPVDHAALAAALRAVAPTLRSVALEYVSATGGGGGADARASAAALAACPRLESLSLHGAADLPHDALAAVLARCTSLRSLSLGYLRHGTIGPPTLAAAAACPRLHTLALHDTRWAPAAAVASAAASLGRRLRCLSLDGVHAFGDADLAATVAACPRLVALTLRPDAPGLLSGAAVARAARALAPRLRLLDLSAAVGAADEDVAAVVAAAPRLRELRLRCAVGCGNAAMFEIAAGLAGSLRVLDVAGTSTSDEGLAALAACARLAALHIGTPAARRPLPPVAAAGALRPAVISNAGVEEALRGCGRSLRRFSCEDIQAALPRPFGAGPAHDAAPPGRAALSGAAVFSSLRQHCSPDLEQVVMQKMQPPLHNRRDRSRMECRMYELEDDCPNVYCWLDREAPPLPPMTLEELLADDDQAEGASHPAGTLSSL